MKAFTLLLALLVLFAVCKKTPRLVDKPAAKQDIEDIIDELFSVIPIKDEDDVETGFFEDFIEKLPELIHIAQPFIKGLMKSKKGIDFQKRFDTVMKIVGQFLENY